MATAAFNEKKLRGIVKSALADAFKENRELMQDIIRETHESIGCPQSSSLNWREVWLVLGRLEGYAYERC